uniref:Uncharacterized protein n=1 Tax=uncultured marine virus TaxID=186617 RepID=A0A0F7LAL6_9VIRU|nr:hypothetical protein [uncultured marine virus]
MSAFAGCALRNFAGQRPISSGPSSRSGVGPVLMPPASVTSLANWSPVYSRYDASTLASAPSLADRLSAIRCLRFIALRMSSLAVFSRAASASAALRT